MSILQDKYPSSANSPRQSAIAEDNLTFLGKKMLQNYRTVDSFTSPILGSNNKQVLRTDSHTKAMYGSIIQKMLTLIIDNESIFLTLGVFSCALGGLLYKYHRDKTMLYKDLENMLELKVDEDLCKKVKACGGKISYAAVQGTISSDGKVIRSVNKKDALGVIGKVDRTEHKVLWDSKSRKWVNKTDTVFSKFKAEPFTLVGHDQNIKLHVLNPRDANAICLELVSRKSEEPQLSLFGLIEYFSGFYDYGTKTLESMLYVGSNVTVLGEVSMTADGRLNIDLPSNDLLRYIISCEPSKKVIEQEKLVLGNRYLYNICIYGLLFLGMLSCSFWVYARYRKNEENALLKKMPENNENDEKTLCVICMDEPCSIIFLPCGHLCACRNCNEEIDDHCPICRTGIESRNRAFFPT